MTTAVAAEIPQRDVASAINRASAAMDRYADGDDRAFAEVYDELAPRLLGWLLRRCGDTALAEDLVQQTLLQMHRARASYRSGADVVPWAFAIARQLTIDAHRKRRREFLWDDPKQQNQESYADDTALPDAHSQSEQLLHCLETTMKALPPNQQQAFALVKSDGLSLSQTSELLGITIGAVKLRLHRAAEALRAAVTAHNATPSAKTRGEP